MSISLCCFSTCYLCSVKWFSWIWMNPPWENWTLNAFACWICRFPLDSLVRCWWALPFCRWLKMRRSLPCLAELFCLDWVLWSSVWGSVVSREILLCGLPWLGCHPWWMNVDIFGPVVLIVLLIFLGGSLDAWCWWFMQCVVVLCVFSCLAFAGL